MQLLQIMYTIRDGNQLSNKGKIESLLGMQQSFI
jgi:hypothetical protein